jgi:allantoinase
VLYKCSPPIRDHDNREQLWRGVLDGVIDFVVTDHSPCTPHLKHVPGGIPDAWGGIASLQLGLPLIWTEAHARGAGLAELAAWTSARAARFAGVGSRKGAIARGFDADFAVWDPEAETEVAAEALFFRHRQQSPYIGARVRGQIRSTWLRGVQIFDGSTPIGKPSGQLLLGRDAPLGVAP